MWRAPYALAKHQEDFVTLFQKQGSGLLLADCGLGKTAAAIAALQDTKSKHHLIISKSVADTRFCEELSTCLGVVDTFLCKGRTPNLPDVLPTWIFCGWEVLKFWEEALLNRIKPFDVIFDEIHYGKNPKRYKREILPDGTARFHKIEGRHTSAHTISKAARHRIGMTATPMPNGIPDLWAQLDLVFPGAFGKYHDFCVRYTEAERGDYGWTYEGSANVTELKRRLADVTIFARRENVTGMPRVTRLKHALDIPVRIPQRVWKSFKGSTDIAEDISGGRYTSSIVEELLSYNVNAKIPWCVERLEHIFTDEDPDSKVIVFTIRREHVERLADKFKARKIPGLSIHTAMGGESDRDAKRKAFINAPGPAVYICTGDSEGESVDGLQCANRGIFLHIPYTVMQVQQWSGRLLRFGGQQHATLEFPYIKGSIDERFFAIILDKIHNNRSLEDSDELSNLSSTIEGRKHKDLLRSLLDL